MIDLGVPVTRIIKQPYQFTFSNHNKKFLQHTLLLLLGLLLASVNGKLYASESDRLKALESQIAEMRLQQDRLAARNEVQNIFSRYQSLHNVFRDEEIIDMWVKKGTPGMSSQYTNTGVYTNWDSIMKYHQNRPTPDGKLLVHFTTTPIIEVAGDGETAKGTWIVAGIESGLSDPEVAKKAPASFFEPGLVDGKKVWAHWVQVRYYLDFLKQDGEWKIWHLRVSEISRAPFSKNWIEFAAELNANKKAMKFHNDIAFFGDDGEVVFMPPVDDKPKNIAPRYQTDAPFTMVPEIPVPYETFKNTFEY